MPSTRADSFRNDPRVAQAKELLLAALAEHQEGLDAARPAQANLAEAYAEDLVRFGDLRGGKLYYDYIGSGIGRGAWVELADGSVKLDMITGIGPHGWGHSDPAIVSAAIDAACEDLVMQGNLQQNGVARDVCAQLLLLANQHGGRFDHCFLTSSGAMANENATKLAFHKRRPADRLFAFTGCFAGRTLGMAYVTDKAAYRVGLPQTVEVDYLPFMRPGEPEESARRTLAVLEKWVKRFPGRHAAFVAEMVQGEGGYWAGDQAFFRPVLERCRELGITVIVDEVQTFGRLQQAFACQHFGCADLVDIVTVGKISQVCATLYRGDHKPEPGLISQTFTSSTSALHAGLYILRQMAEGYLYGGEGRNAQIGIRFRAVFGAIAERHPDLLSGPWGIDAMLACTPLGGDRAKVVSLAKRCFTEGVMGFIAGSDPCRMRFLPPIGVITDGDIDAAGAIFEAALLAEAAAG